MDKHNHSLLRGHIEPEAFMPGLREQWRSTRYWEALRAHHTYSNDRPSLLSLTSKLNAALDAELGVFSENTVTPILDVGCGTGEVAADILNALNPKSRVAYSGIDKNGQILSSPYNNLGAATSGCVKTRLAVIDYRDESWNRHSFLSDSAFRMIWLIHSGYYLEGNHDIFMDQLQQLADLNGLLLFIHNTEGNEPYLSAAEQRGMPAYRVRYKRSIQVPDVPEDVFDILRNSPGDLESFSAHFSSAPEARAFRLMLEFYLPEYPLEALNQENRNRYILNWKKQLEDHSGEFHNDHELLLILSKQHVEDFRLRLEDILHRTFDDGEESNLFRYHC